MAKNEARLKPMGCVIGHRGAAAYAPENTLASFNKARELGCNFIEFDVMLSADGEAFIFHDESLARTTNGRGEFGLATADDIRSLDAGAWYEAFFRGEKIPSLTETLQWLIETDVRANIEIKPYPGRTQETTEAVIVALRHHWPSEKKLPLISSFDIDALRLCHRLAPELPLGLLLDRWRKDALLLAEELACVSVHLSHRATSAKRVLALKQQAYQVYVYTVNHARQAAKLFALGVDAVFSDYPDLLRK